MTQPAELEEFIAHRMDGGPFIVFIFFRNGQWRITHRERDPQKAFEALVEHTKSDRAKSGAIRRILIINRGDFEVISWKYRRGFITNNITRAARDIKNFIDKNPQLNKGA